VKARTTLFVLLLLALPVSGFSQSTLNYPRLFPAADLSSSGFAAVNPSAAAATITFTLYSAAGGTVANTTHSVPARAGITKLGSELFPGVATPGWVQATSTTTGLQGFWLGYEPSRVDYLDGAESAPAGQEFIFPLATGTTELNIANVSTSTNTITIRIYGAAGTELANAVQPASLAPNGIFKNTLASIFPSVNFTNAMYVKVTGTGNITGTTVAVDFILAPSWSVINGISTATTATEANFPHVPSGPESGGPKWSGTIGITNFSSTAQTVTLTYNRSSGTPVSVTRALSGNGSLRENVQSMFSFGGPAEDGWVKVTGSAPLSGYIAYGYSGANGVAVVPVQAVPQTQLMFAHVANGSFWATGLALLNATATDAAIEVYVMRRDDGALVGGSQDVLTASINLPAGGKIARLIDQLVPPALFDDGFVYVKSANNVPLYAFQLFYVKADVRAISNVAAGVIDPSITFTPPAPPSPLPPLTLSSITPSPVARSSAVTLTGSGFSATPGSNSVVFTTATGAVSAIPSSASSGSLTVTVPSTAITGPVYVTTGGRFTPSIVLSVNATATTTITSTIAVNASQNTIADIYVSPPVNLLNASDLGISLTTESTASIGSSSVEMTAGTTRRLWITGAGISSATNVAVSGTGITVSSSGVTAPDYVIVHVAVAPGTAPGPRNIVLTNGTLDASIVTGGLIIR
jgi:hypothetical protein